MRPPAGAAESGRLPGAFLATGSASFTEFLGAAAPQLVPGRSLREAVGSSYVTEPERHVAPHGTTVVSLSFSGGVVIAGDRRATMGNLIASRDIDKVFVTDEHSAVGIAGTAGLAVELVKLFQVELEHFEKIEGTVLSLEGKANRLAAMIRGNLGLAMQGLAVVPMFVGFDGEARVGRMFSYDVTGGCYEERHYHGIGSGSIFARGALKKLWRADLTQEQALRIAVEALYDAADDDSATGGPDLARRIWPTSAVVGADGARLVSDDVLAGIVETVVAERRIHPGGPR